MIQTKVSNAIAGAEKYYLYIDFTSLHSPLSCFVLQVIHIQ